MKKVFHLSNCNTCQRILAEVNAEANGFLPVEIKTEGISEADLDQMKTLAGSYEALFSRRAMKFRSMGLNEMSLSEADYKKYILEEYTFLKRPVFLTEDAVFVGNSKKSVEAVKTYLSEL